MRRFSLIFPILIFFSLTTAKTHEEGVFLLPLTNNFRTLYSTSHLTSKYYGSFAKLFRKRSSWASAIRSPRNSPNLPRKRNNVVSQLTSTHLNAQILLFGDINFAAIGGNSPAPLIADGTEARKAFIVLVALFASHCGMKRRFC